MLDVYEFFQQYLEDYIQENNKPGVFFEQAIDNNYQNYIMKIDDVLVKKILDNLIDNALKYTSKGKVVVGFDIKEDSREVVFFVKDTGVGIPKKDQIRIFKNFVTVEDPYQSDYSGTGIGLSIVDRIVKMIGGKIILDSEPHNGSAFYVFLPLDIRPR